MVERKPFVFGSRGQPALQPDLVSSLATPHSVKFRIDTPSMVNTDLGGFFYLSILITTNEVTKRYQSMRLSERFALRFMMALHNDSCLCRALECFPERCTSLDMCVARTTANPILHTERSQAEMSTAVDCDFSSDCMRQDLR